MIRAAATLVALFFAAATPAFAQHDDVFTDLVRDGQGRAMFAAIRKSQRPDIGLGPNYRAVTIGRQRTGRSSASSRRPASSTG